MFLVKYYDVVIHTVIVRVGTFYVILNLFLGVQQQWIRKEFSINIDYYTQSFAKYRTGNIVCYKV